MTLEEFLELLEKEKEAFASYWRVGHRNYGDEAYPLDMPKEEWLAYLEEYARG